MNRGIFFWFAFCTFVVCSPLAIASIALNQNGVSGGCDHLDLGTTLTVAQWLLGCGVAGLVVGYILCVCLFFMRNNFLFGVNWSIIGVFVIFHTDIECIHEGITNVSFALGLWCTAAFVICINIVKLFPK